MLTEVVEVIVNPDSRYSVDIDRTPSHHLVSVEVLPAMLRLAVILLLVCESLAYRPLQEYRHTQYPIQG